MTFLPTIPARNDRLAQSQVDLQNNMGKLNSTFALNHVTFSDSTVNSGKHTHVDMRAGADPATILGEGSSYVKNTGAARDHLFYRREFNGLVIPMTQYFAAMLYYDVATATVIWRYNVNTFAVGGDLFTYNLTFPAATQMLNTNYFVVASVQGTTGISPIYQTYAITNKVVGGFRLRLFNSGTENIGLIVIGETV